MKLKNWGLGLFLLLPSLLFAQEVDLKRERTFTGSGLYGFMNGGADQFLEYGVQKLVARDVVYNGEAYMIEIYDMPTPEDAFGIYSLHVFKCQRADTLGCVDCLSPYQLQAVAGNQYVSVVFPSGSKKAKEGVDELIRKYVSLEGNSVEIPSMLGLTPPFSGVLKYLRGPLSATTASFAFATLVQDVSYSGIWFAADKRAKSYSALINVSDRQEIDKIKSKIASTDILEEGESFIFISGKEVEKEEQDYGPFGF